MSKPKRILIARHGQSEGNVDKTLFAIKPDFSLRLTEKGIEQSKNLGIKINELLGNERLAVYYSPYFRTIETLNNLAINLPTGMINREFLREEPRIREHEWSGQLREGCDDDIETERDSYGPFYYRFDSGESCADVYDRVSDFFTTLHRDFEKPNFPDNVLLVMHGMSMRLFLMKWFHKTVAEFETWANPWNCDMWILNKTKNDKYEFDFSTLKSQQILHNYKMDLLV